MGDAMTPRPTMGDSVMKNLSPMNPADKKLMATQLSPDMTVREWLGKMGVDVDGPVTQLVEMGQRMQKNANPLEKMKSISADASLKQGGQPPTMPGVKPMVQPPGRPAPAGLEGIVNKLGG